MIKANWRDTIYIRLVMYQISEMRSIRGLTLIKLMKNEPNGHTRVIIGCLLAREPMNPKITYSNGRHPLIPHDSTVQASWHRVFTPLLLSL